MDLRASDLSLFVDGREAANFACDRGEDRLKYTPRSLQRGRHTVRVEATDARGLEGSETWSFRVVGQRQAQV